MNRSERRRLGLDTVAILERGGYELDGARVNLSAALERAIEGTIEYTIDKVLSIAAHHDHDAMVLGAWGCGVFKNDPRVVAELFADALHGRFAGAFARVTFAILDTSDERRFIGPFERCFAST